MSRPKLCRACHAPATFIEYTPRAAVVVKRDSSVRRGTEEVGVYYCDEHTGMPA